MNKIPRYDIVDYDSPYISEMGEHKKGPYIAVEDLLEFLRENKDAEHSEIFYALNEIYPK